MSKVQNSDVNQECLHFDSSCVFKMVFVDFTTDVVIIGLYYC